VRSFWPDAVLASNAAAVTPESLRVAFTTWIVFCAGVAELYAELEALPAIAELEADVVGVGVGVGVGGVGVGVGVGVGGAPKQVLVLSSTHDRQIPECQRHLSKLPLFVSSARSCVQ